MIKFLDLRKINNEFYKTSVNITNFINDSVLIGGPKVEEFECAWARFVGANCCVAVGNGLDALTISIIALDLKPRSKIVVPANTFIATWLSVIHSGHEVVPVDCDETANICPARLADVVQNEDIKAIIIVHLYGTPANLFEIQQVAASAGIPILEDAAQAHGATIEGQKIGSFGNTAAWSFYPGKCLGALGDGGAITTDDEDLARKYRMLRNYGSETKYIHEVQGLNSRLDALQAEFLMKKLQNFDEDLSIRRSIAEEYCSGITNSRIRILTNSYKDSSNHLFVIEVDDVVQFKKHMIQYEVETARHYPFPPHLQSAFENLGYKEGDFQNTENFAKRVISLPIGPHMGKVDVQKTIFACNQY